MKDEINYKFDFWREFDIHCKECKYLHDPNEFELHCEKVGRVVQDIGHCNYIEKKIIK